MILRELFTKLGLDVDEAAFAKGELAAAAVKAGLEKLADAAIEAVDHFVEMVKQTAEAGKELKETAQATGLSTKALQEWRDVAGESGISAGALDASVFQLARMLRMASAGGGDAGAAFTKLGVHIKDAHGKMRDTDAVMMDLADGFAKLPDGLTKTGLAAQVFGRMAGPRLIPLLDKGRQGIAELRSEVTVMTDEQLEAGKELEDTQYALGLVTRNLWRSAIAPLLPSITALVKRFLEWRKANAAIMSQRIGKVIGAVVWVVDKLADAFSFLVKNATGVELILGALVTYFLLTQQAAVAAALRTVLAWAVAAAPFVAIAAAIGALLLIFDDLRVYSSGKGKSMFGEFKKHLDKWLEPTKDEPWFLTAIKDFVRLLDEAIEMVREFNEATGRVSATEVDRRAGMSKAGVRAQADVQTQASARRRVELGLPLTRAERAALGRQGITPEAFTAAHAPGGPGIPGPSPAPTPEYLAAPTPELPAQPGGRALALQQTNQITINAPPGMTADELVRAQNNAATDALQSWTEEAAAAWP